MQDGTVIFRIVVRVNFDSLALSAGNLGRGAGGNKGLQDSLAYPRALCLTRALNIEEANGSAIELELVLDAAIEGEGLGTGEINAAILELLTVVDADGDEAAGLGMAGVAGEFENGDGAEDRRIFVVLFDLAGILGGGG